MYPRGGSIHEWLAKQPDSAVRDVDQLSYVTKKDTESVVNGARSVDFLWNSMTAGANKTSRQHNLNSFQRGMFGDGPAWIIGVRFVLPETITAGTVLVVADARALRDGFVTFTLNKKPVFETYVSDLPQGEGLYHQIYTTTNGAGAPLITGFCNGFPAIDNRFMFDEPVLVMPLDTHRMTVEWPAGIAMAGTAELVVKLDGYAVSAPR